MCKNFFASLSIKIIGTKLNQTNYTIIHKFFVLQFALDYNERDIFKNSPDCFIWGHTVSSFILLCDFSEHPESIYVFFK